MEQKTVDPERLSVMKRALDGVTAAILGEPLTESEIRNVLESAKALAAPLPASLGA